jgi:tetratricopeptide (TPR) repeat protein
MRRDMGRTDNLAVPSSGTVRAGQSLVVGLLLLTPVVFWRGGLEPFESCKVALIQLTALALLAAGAMSLTFRFDAVRRRLRRLIADPVSLAMVLGAVEACVSTLNSLSPRTSWYGLYENEMGLMTTIALLVVYFAARTVFADASRGASSLATAVTLALVPVTLYAILQMFRLDPFVWEETSAFAHWTRPFSTLGHPNYLAGYIVMVLPVVAWMAWQCAVSGRGRMALALTLLAAASCGVAVTSLSRAAWLVIILEVLAALAIGGWWLAKKPHPPGREEPLPPTPSPKRRGGATSPMRERGTSPPLPPAPSPKRRGGEREESHRLGEGAIGFAHRRIFVLALFVVFLAGAAGAVALGMGHAFRQRVEQITGLGGRGPIWAGSWRIFVEHPWTGCGLETFDFAFRRQGTAAFWRWEWGSSATRAHNDLLHTLATQGIPGGTAFLLLAGTLVWAARRSWQSGRAVDRPLIIALSAGVLAWYVQNSFCFPVAPTACLFVVLAAQLSRLAWPGPDGVAEPCKPDAPARCVFRKSAASLAARRASEGVDIPRLRVGLPRSWTGGEFVKWSSGQNTRHLFMGPRSPTRQRGSCRPISLACASGLWAVLAALLAYFLVAKPYLAACISQRGDQLCRADLVRALECHERAVRLDPGRDFLWNKLGTCALMAAESCPVASRRHDLLIRAREASKEACRLVPASSENHANRARILYVLAREGLAFGQDVLDAYDTALALDPENTLYLADAAGAAVGLGRLDRARAYASRGLRIEPDLGILHVNLAAIELARGRHAEAERSLLRSLAGRWHDPSRWDQALLLLCLTYLDTTRGEPALRLADELLQRQDTLPVRCLRARALEKLGRRQEAWNEYQRIVQARPGYAAARAGLARLERVGKNGKSRQGFPAGSAD